MDPLESFLALLMAQLPVDRIDGIVCAIESASPICMDANQALCAKRFRIRIDAARMEATKRKWNALSKELQ